MWQIFKRLTQRQYIERDLDNAYKDLQALQFARDLLTTKRSQKYSEIFDLQTKLKELK